MALYRTTHKTKEPLKTSSLSGDASDIQEDCFYLWFDLFSVAQILKSLTFTEFRSYGLRADGLLFTSLLPIIFDECMCVCFSGRMTFK